MSTKLTFFVSALFLAIVFWACGDGSIYTTTEEDSYHIQKMKDDMDGVMKRVRESCEADSACRESIELSGGWPTDSVYKMSNEAESSSDVKPDSSEKGVSSSSVKPEGPAKGNSSSEMQPPSPEKEGSSSSKKGPPDPKSSSSKIEPLNSESSSSKIGPPDPKDPIEHKSSSSFTPKTSSSSTSKSSSSSAPPLEPFAGTCKANTTKATTDESVTWNLEVTEGHENRGDFKWHFDSDAEILTNVKDDYQIPNASIKNSNVTGTGKVPNSITVRYAENGDKTETYVSLNGVRINCNKQRLTITKGSGSQESSSSESSSSESSSSESSSSNGGGPGVLDDGESSSSANSSSGNDSPSDVILINENPSGKTYQPGSYKIGSLPDGRNLVCNVHFVDNSNKVMESFKFTEPENGNTWNNGQSATVTIQPNVEVEFVSGTLRFESCW